MLSENMKNQIKKQRGFIQVQILLAIISAVIFIGAAITVPSYQKISNLLREANQFTNEKKYNEAYGKLQEAQSDSLSNIFGILDNKINEAIDNNEKLSADEYERQNQEKTNGALQATEIEKLKNEVEQLKSKPTSADSINNQGIQKNILPAAADVAQPNTTLCNGKYWTACPSGQKFYCPPTGDAQCFEEQKQATTNTSMSAQQKCLTDGLNTLTETSNKRLKEIEDSLGGYVSAKQKALDNQLSWYADSLYRIQLWCGTVSTEEQMIHELQKIRESLDKLGS